VKQLKQLSPRYVARYEAHARLLDRRMHKALEKFAGRLIREYQREAGKRRSRRPTK